MRWWFVPDPVDAGASSGRQARTGTLSLVCVRHFQDAVAVRSPGDRVYLVREHGNPYDADAIVVVDTERATLGLVGRDSWLHQPLLNEGVGCSAWINQINRGASGTLSVVIQVELTGAAIGMRAYRPPAPRAHARSPARVR